MSALGWILVGLVVAGYCPQLVAWAITFVVARWFWLLARSVFRI